MLDPKSDVYQQRLGPARGEGARETAQQIQERLKEQIRTQHLHQLLGASAIDAETYPQRLPQLLATRRPEMTVEDIERRLSNEVSPAHGRGGQGSRD